MRRLLLAWVLTLLLVPVPPVAASAPDAVTVPTEVTVVVSNLDVGDGTTYDWSKEVPWAGGWVTYDVTVGVAPAPSGLHRDLQAHLANRTRTWCNDGCWEGVEGPDVAAWLADNASRYLDHPPDLNRTLFVVNLSGLGDHGMLRTGPHPVTDEPWWFTHPSDLWVDPNNNVVVADAAATRVNRSAYDHPAVPKNGTAAERVRAFADAALEHLLFPGGGVATAGFWRGVRVDVWMVAPAQDRYDAWTESFVDADAWEQGFEGLWGPAVDVRLAGVVLDDDRFDEVNQNSTVDQAGVRSVDLDSLRRVASDLAADKPPDRHAVPMVVALYDEPVGIGPGGFHGFAVPIDAPSGHGAVGIHDTVMRNRDEQDPETYRTVHRNALRHLVLHEVGHLLSLPHPAGAVTEDQVEWGPGFAGTSAMASGWATNLLPTEYTLWDRRTHASNLMMAAWADSRLLVDDLERSMARRNLTRDDLPAADRSRLRRLEATVGGMARNLTADPLGPDGEGDPAAIVDGFVRDARTAEVLHSRLEAGISQAEPPPDPDPDLDGVDPRLLAGAGLAAAAAIGVVSLWLGRRRGPEL